MSQFGFDNNYQDFGYFGKTNNITLDVVSSTNQVIHCSVLQDSLGVFCLPQAESASQGTVLEGSEFFWFFRYTCIFLWVAISDWNDYASCSKIFPAPEIKRGK